MIGFQLNVTPRLLPSERVVNWAYERETGTLADVNTLRIYDANGDPITDSRYSTGFKDLEAMKERVFDRNQSLYGENARHYATKTTLTADSRTSTIEKTLRNYTNETTSK